MATAAAAWSCVEKMLHDAHRTSAPSSTSVSMSTAVWIVMCSEPEMRAPASGLLGPNSARRARQTGHLVLGEVDLLASERGERDIGDAKVAPRGGCISRGHGGEVYGSVVGVGSGPRCSGPSQRLLDELQRGDGSRVDTRLLGHRDRHEVAVEHEVEELGERPFALCAHLLDAADDLFLE